MNIQYYDENDFADVFKVSWEPPKGCGPPFENCYADCAEFCS